MNGWAGDPDVKCPFPTCGRRVVDSRIVHGAKECVCNICGFTWSGTRGITLKGQKWKKDTKGWVIDR